MLLGPAGWDAVTVDHHYDVTTKLTALYLLASAVVFYRLPSHAGAELSDR